MADIPKFQYLVNVVAKKNLKIKPRKFLSNGYDISHITEECNEHRDI